MTTPTVNILGKSLMLSLSSLAPLAASLLTIFAFTFAYGSAGALAVGMSGNILGITVAISVGCAVTAVRAITALRAHLAKNHESSAAQEFTAALRREHNNAYVMSALILVMVAVVSLVTWLSRAPHFEAYLYYLAGGLLWILLLPLAQVSSGALQAFDQDRKILTASLMTLLLNQAIVATVAAVKPDLQVALLIASSCQSIAAFLVYLYRLKLVQRLTGINLRSSFALAALFTRASVVDRVLAGSDGLIFMSYFLVATLIAGSHSAHDGAIIATVVGFMRLLVIPLKQFGMVGGRLLLRRVNPPLTPRAIQRQALFPCLIAAAGGFIFAYLRLPEAAGLLLGLMIVAQILLEPYAGVTYSLSKIMYGPRTFVGVLGVCYLAIGMPALLILGVAGLSSALAVWTSVFVTRVLFTAAVQWRLRALRQAPGESVTT